MISRARFGPVNVFVAKYLRTAVLMEPHCLHDLLLVR